MKMFRRSVSILKAFYETQDVVNTLVAGNVSYPRTDDSPYAHANAGMAFELRYVRRQYSVTALALTPNQGMSLSRILVPRKRSLHSKTYR